MGVWVLKAMKQAGSRFGRKEEPNGETDEKIVKKEGKETETASKGLVALRLLKVECEAISFRRSKTKYEDWPFLSSSWN